MCCNAHGVPFGMFGVMWCIAQYEGGGMVEVGDVVVGQYGGW